MKKNIFRMLSAKNLKNIKLNSAFTILELLITMVLVSALTAPILNTFQVSERLGERSKRSFVAQNLAREMMAEISAKSFNDPDEPDTINVNLKPGPYHEEYKALAPKLQNGTDENGAPRFFNETLLNRNKYFDDIDDYADYNTDETLLPTLSSGKEYLVNGQNLYENYRIKVSVTTDTSKTMESKSVLDNGIIPGTLLTGIAATTDSRYILSLNGDEKTVSVINTKTNKEIDTDPSTAASDRIKLDNSAIPSKILLGASQDRFFVLNKAVNDNIESTSSISVIDMNPFNAPEYSFHKVHDITSNGLKSNSFTAIAADKKSRIFAGTVNGGLVRSLDNGVSWQLMNIKTDSGDIENTITCLATVNYGYGTGSDITYAGSAGGLWYTENGGDSWKKIPNVKNVTAVAVMPNGYMAAGLSSGKLYGFKKFAANDEFPFRSAISGPVPNAVDSIVIDKNYNLIIASNGKTYYSANFFDSDISAGSLPAPVFSQYSQIPDDHNVSSLYIDKSATCPADFKKITGLTPGAPTAREFAPTIYANEAGIHLFYLSGEAAGPGGTIATPQLYYVSSSNCGQSWSAPKKISYLNKSLEPAWAHSEAIDKYGTIHVSWFSKMNNCWKLCYQRGDRYGLSWLTSEVILAGDTVDICINELKFSETSDPEWALNGAGKHQNICVSPLNRVYIAFSGNSNSKFHYLIWSYDGGIGWAAKEMIKIPKPADRNDEIVESINCISPDNRLLWIFKSAEKRRMMITDSNGNVLSGQNGCFDISQISESAPLLMDKNLTYRYFYIKNNRLGQQTGNFPYAECRGASYSFQPYADDIFQSVNKNNNIYTFYKSQNKIFAIKSSNNGIDAQVPIFICDCGAGGSAASAAYRNNVYFVTGPEDLSSNSSLQLCLFSDETLFGGGRNFCFTEDLKNFPAILSGNTYQDCGFTVNCFQGDANGNILCGTSDGLLVLSSRTANTVEKAGDIYSAYNSKFRSVTAGGQAKTWAAYFKGVKITSVCLEPGGSFWAATADRGIFHSSDYGESWENITANIADIVDISVPGTGQAADINKINIFSRRHNLKISQDGSSAQIIQHLASVFNLSNNKIESVTVISDNYGGGKTAAASYDNSKIYLFEKNEKNIYSKKHNRISKNIVQAAQSGYLLTGLIANANDTLEISAAGKFWLDKENTYFCSTAAGLNCDFRQDAAGKNYIGSLILKTGSGYASVNQYYNGQAIGSGEMAYQISADSYSKTNGFLTVTTGINSAREVINLQNKINSAANLIAAPDNQTLYAIDAGSQKVYAVTNINNPAQITVKEYSKNINIPLDVIFSPKNSDGQFKTHIVCQSNIIDLEGNKILNEASAFNIQAAIANDGGDLFFIDKLTKKIFKCSKVNEKTVYVTVSDTDVRAAGSMPPVTIAKKFYQWRSGDFKSYHLVGGQKPNRDYFKYQFIYTSKEYPSGIAAGQKVRWQLKKSGTNDILNVYVVDSVLDINGELEIQPAALVKFAAANKNINPDNFSGKASSCLKTNTGGKLTIGGKVNDNEKVIFTSIDDNQLAPSVYNAPDGVFSTADGYPNTQIAKGPMPGDWGYSDGESKQYGGIQLQPGDDITGLEAYYGLFYTASLYPESITKKNYDNCQGEGGLLNEWQPTNVFVVNNQLEIQSGSSLTATQGTIIKFAGAGKIKINGGAQQLPGPSVIFNGSFAKNIIMDSITAENISGEFKTPSKSTSGYWTFIDSSNTCENGIFKNITAGNANTLSLNGSSLNFINCNFKLANPGIFKAEMRQKDFSNFINCEFNINRGGILSTLGSSNEFMSCTFGNKPYQTGSDEDYGIKSSEGASIYLKNNKFEYIQSGSSSSSDSSVNGSRIYSDSIISAENNFFYNVSANSAASCEITLSGKSQSLVWPEICSNTFEKAKLSFYIDGMDTTAAYLKEAFYNNIFNSCAKLAAVKIPANGSGPGELSITGNITSDRFDNIYIIDGGSNTLNKYTSGGRHLMQIGGTGTDKGKFKGIYDAAVNDTCEIYVTEKNNCRIQKFDKSGNFMLSFGGYGNTPGKFLAPAGIKVLSTPTAEIIFVTDSLRNKLMKFKPDGSFIEEIGKSGSALEQFNTPLGITISRDCKYVYLADSANNRIQKIKALLDTVEVEKFEITALNGIEAKRGEYIKLKVRALDKDGNLITGYNKSGTITIDYVPGVVNWSGNGITDKNSDTSDNGAKFDYPAFTGGEAYIYVTSMHSYAARRINIMDDENPDMKGTIDLTWLDGPEYSLKCNGSSSYVKLPNFLLPSKVTIETWFKTNDCGTIFSIENRDFPSTPSNFVPVLYVGTDGNLYGKFWDSRGQAGAYIVRSASAVNDFIWHHCALTYDGSMYRLYLDGIKVSELAGSIAQLDMDRLHIGTGYTATCWDPSNRDWFYFDGLIDEFRVWNFALDENQIKQSMNSTLSGTETGLIGYYKFNEPQGADPVDSSQNASKIGNGSLKNGAVYSDDYK